MVVAIGPAGQSSVCRPLDWSDNIAISALAPATYWPQQLAAKSLAGDRLTTMMYWHALPEGWQDLPFQEFLAARRKRMAFVVRDATARLADPNYRPDYAGPITAAAPTQAGELRGLVDADLLPPGTTLVTGDGAGQQLAHVLPDGCLYADGETYDGLFELSDALGIRGNPWALWAAEEVRRPHIPPCPTRNARRGPAAILLTT